MIGDAAQGYPWSRAIDQTRTSNANGEPMMFPMSPGRIYHLIEVSPPPGYMAPTGQWRLVVVASSTAPAGYRLSLQSIGDVPDIVYRYDNGYTYFIGNRPEFELPLTGGDGVAWFNIAGFSVIGATAMAVLFVVWGKDKKKKPLV